MNKVPREVLTDLYLRRCRPTFVSEAIFNHKLQTADEIENFCNYSELDIPDKYYADIVRHGTPFQKVKVYIGSSFFDTDIMCPDDRGIYADIFPEYANIFAFANI